MASTHNVTEEEPLLGTAANDDPELAYEDGQLSPQKKRWAIAMAYLLVMIVDLAAYFQIAPQTSIIESIVCKRYYDSITPTDGQVQYTDKCTVSPVQAEVATILQLASSFNLIPAFLVCMPYGILSDRIGRRPVIILVVIGTLLQDLMSKVILWRPDIFAPRLLWLSSVSVLIGGSDTVGSSMIVLMIADVAAAEHRAMFFFFVGAASMIGEIIATPISALLMTLNPWISYFVYTGFMVLGLLVAVFLVPETLPKTPKTVATEPLLGSQTTSEEEEEDSMSGTKEKYGVLSQFKPLLKRNIIAISISFLVSILARHSSSFFLQYIHLRFDLSYEKASVLLTLRAASTLALMLVLLPGLDKFLLSRGMTNDRKDLFICRASIILSSVGLAILSVAPIVGLAGAGIIIFALGNGFGASSRSLATGFVKSTETGMLYSVITVVQSLGLIISGPLLTVTFRWGLELGREWSGVPFAFMIGLFAISFVALVIIRL